MISNPEVLHWMLLLISEILLVGNPCFLKQYTPGMLEVHSWGDHGGNNGALMQFTKHSE